MEFEFLMILMEEKTGVHYRYLFQHTKAIDKKNKHLFDNLTKNKVTPLELKKGKYLFIFQLQWLILPVI